MRKRHNLHASENISNGKKIWRKRESGWKERVEKERERETRVDDVGKGQTWTVRGKDRS